MTDYAKMFQSSNTSGGQTTQSSQPQGVTQNVSDFFRSIGLGAIPTIGAGIYEGGRAISSALGNKNAYVNQQTGQQVQDPFATYAELSNYSTPAKGAIQAAKDTAGLASYAVPEVGVIPEGGNALTHILAAAGNHAIQGAGQGALNAVATGNNPIQGAGIGAAVNPVMSGLGNILTDALPKYIGIRNFGLAGKDLPAVTNAEDVAAKAGNTLEDVRDAAMQGISWGKDLPETLQNKGDLYDSIKDLANSPKYVGTPGISDLVQKGRTGLQNVGDLPDINASIGKSQDPFEAYNRIRNMADWAQTNIGNKGESFIKQAAHTAREYAINSTDDPVATRQAMDMYAAQTAMNAGGQLGGNKLQNILGSAAQKIGPDVGVGLFALAPALHGLAPLAAVDTALTNPVTGPTLARELVRAGSSSLGQGIGNLLTRLGISGVQGLASNQ